MISARLRSRLDAATRQAPREIDGVLLDTSRVSEAEWTALLNVLMWIHGGGTVRREKAFEIGDICQRIRIWGTRQTYADYVLHLGGDDRA
jgi:hypothetical protein